MAEIRKEADQKEKESEAHLKHHSWLAKSITMFQVAIAVGAISVLTRRKLFWFVCIGFGAVGIVLLGLGLVL